VSRRLLTQAWRRFHLDAGWRSTDAGLLPGMAVAPAMMDDVLPSPSAVVTALSLAGSDPELVARAVRARDAAAGSVAASPFWYAGHAGLLIAGTAPPAQR